MLLKSLFQFIVCVFPYKCVLILIILALHYNCSCPSNSGNESYLSLFFPISSLQLLDNSFSRQILELINSKKIFFVSVGFIE